MFIGREQELRFLEDRYCSSKAELIILYGRRRVGKTETLKQFCMGKEHVFFTCTEVTDHAQLQKFSESLLSTGMEASKYVTSFEDWEMALSSVSQLPFQSKKLVIIDEFPYMCKGNRSIPSILQKLWDLNLKNENIMLVLCGSAMSFIEKEILSEKNPLYGRTTGIFKMKEMGFYDAAKFFPSYSAVDKISTYAILGGIPHYLLQFEQSLSVEENIKKNVLMKGCPLYTETEFLLKQELRETAYYNMLISAIAMGATSLQDITTKTSIGATKASVYLKNLAELGIVGREFSMSHKIRNAASNSRGLYHLNDHFFRFWYAFVFPNLGQLESGNLNDIYQYVIEPGMSRYVSFTFEDVCRQFVRRLSNEGKLPFPASEIGRWWGKRTERNAESGKLETRAVEIDLIAEDYRKEFCIAGECKYTNETVGPSVLSALREKYPPDSDNLQVIYALFSKSGFKDSMPFDAEDVLLFTIDEIAEGKGKE